MKKILNDPFNYVDEMLDGLCSAHPEFYRQAGEGGRADREWRTLGSEEGEKRSRREDGYHGRWVYS